MLTGKFKLVFHKLCSSHRLNYSSILFLFQTGDTMSMTENVYHCLMTTPAIFRNRFIIMRNNYKPATDQLNFRISLHTNSGHPSMHHLGWTHEEGQMIVNSCMVFYLLIMIG